jgi:hypothetical protein
MSHRSAIVALPLAVLVATLACSDPATEPPASDGFVPDFSVPESTLAVLARSVHDRNLANYRLCLGDSLLEGRGFHAAFDPADLNQYVAGGGTPPADWTAPAEAAFFPRFVALYPNEAYDVRFTPDPGRGGIVDVGGPTQKRIYHLRYRVYAGSTIVVAGAVGMNFERLGLAADDKITYWEDLRDTTGVMTWGLARLEH